MELYNKYFLPEFIRMKDYVNKYNLHNRTLVVFNFNDKEKSMLERLETLCGALEIKMVSYTYPLDLTEKDLDDLMEMLNWTQDTIATGVIFINMHERVKFLLDYLSPIQDIAALTSTSSYINPMAKGIVEYFDNNNINLKGKTVYIACEDRHIADLIDVLHDRGCKVIWGNDKIKYSYLEMSDIAITSDDKGLNSFVEWTGAVKLDRHNIFDLSSLALLENLIYERDRL